MTDVLHALRWASAVVGVVFLLIGLVLATGRRPSTGRNFGLFAVQFGTALILFDAGGYLAPNRGWSIAATLAGAVLLASSVRKLFTLRSS